MQKEVYTGVDIMSKGRAGELLFKEIMQARAYQVEDVSNNPDYWHKDIDFVITSPTTGAVKTFEVKWDSCINSTGNLYLELTNIHSRGGKGWFNFCQADYLAYGDAVNKVFYIIPFADLKERVAQMQCRVARCGADSTGKLVQLDKIADICYQL